MGSAFKNRSSVAFTLAVVLAVVFLSYLPVLKSDFVLWDDDVHLLNNITLRALDGEHLRDIFTSTVNKIYIPLTSLSFAVEYHCFGLNPFVYHLDNLLLHLAVVGGVFALSRRLGLSVLGAGVSTLFFGIHPMRVESVAWVTERKDVLYAFFYLAAVLSYLRHLEKGSYRWLALTTFLGVLSMLAKPMALSLPLILVLLDWFKGRAGGRVAFLEKLPLGLLIAAIGWMTYSTHVRLPGQSVTTSVLIWPWTFVFYLRQFFFPFFSVPVYRLPHPVSLANLEYLLSLLAFFLILVSLWRLRRYRWFLFAGLFYFLSIFFLLRFDDVKDTNIVADRFMYFPGMGFCLLLGFLADGLKRRWDHPPFVALRWSFVLGLTALALVFSVRTLNQCRVWHDGITLWEHQLRYFPDEYIALNNLATALGKKEPFARAQEEYRKIVDLRKKKGIPGLSAGEADLSPEAVGYARNVEYLIGLYKKALAVNSEFIDAQYNLGELYSHVGMIPEAVEAYKKALLLDYEYKDAHFSLGNLYSKAGDVRQAVYAYDQALRLHGEEEEVYINVVQAYNDILKDDPQNTAYRQARRKALEKFTQMIGRRPPKAGSYFNLGVLLAEIGDPGRAISAYRMALDINPRHTDSLYNLGNIHRDTGHWKEALEMYGRVIELDPKRSDAYLNIGIIYGQKGDSQSAGRFYAKALKADPKNARAYFNLGYLEETAGNLRKAVDFYQKSTVLDPEDAQGHYNLGNVYAKLKMEDMAISSYLTSVQIDAEHMDAWVNLSILSFQKGDFVHAVKYCDEAVLLGYEAPQGYLDALAHYRTKASHPYSAAGVSRGGMGDAIMDGVPSGAKPSM